MNQNKPQVFIFHFAGGSCYSFQEMIPFLSGLEVHQIELPGRGKRMMEELIQSADAAAVDLYNQVKRLIKEAPFVIYGHSMGATLGLKVVSLLEADGLYPVKFIASGNPGPGVERDQLKYNLPPEEFKAALRELGGIEEEFLNTPELYEFFEPILRADFRLVEEKEIEIAKPLKTPIHALMGSEEKTVTHIKNWQNFTRSELKTEVLTGDHFFVNNSMEYLAKIIREELNKSLN